MQSLIDTHTKILTIKRDYTKWQQYLELQAESIKLLNDMIETEEIKTCECDICMLNSNINGQKKCVNNCKLSICEKCQQRIDRCPMCRTPYGELFDGEQSKLVALQNDDIEFIRQRYREIFRNISGDPNKYQKRYIKDMLIVTPELHFDYQRPNTQPNCLRINNKLRLHENEVVNAIDPKRCLINIYNDQSQVMMNIMVDYRNANDLKCVDYETINKVLFNNTSIMLKEFTKQSNIDFVCRYGKRKMKLFGSELQGIWYLSQQDNKYYMMFE